MPLKSNYGVKQLDKPNPFFKNFGKKTIAVVIAIMLWIVANLEFDIEKTYNIPVKYTNLNPNLIITNNPPEPASKKLLFLIEAGSLEMSASIIQYLVPVPIVKIILSRIESDCVREKISPRIL